MKRKSISLLIQGMLLALCLAACGGQRPLPTPGYSPPPATPTKVGPAITDTPTWPTLPPTVIVPEGLPFGTPAGVKIAESMHFVFYVEDDALPLTQVEELKDDLERVFAYVSNRLGASVRGKIALTFSKPSSEACPLRGIAGSLLITIYADESTSREQILSVAAHEIGHQIQYQNFGPGGPVDDAILTEGLATWAAGHYWNAWQGASSFDDSVRSYLQNGRFIPLLEYDPWDQSGDCLARRDIAYTERASFIGYLIQYYGIDKLIALFETFKAVTFDTLPTALIPQEADYKAIYGKSFQELEVDWLRYLLAGSRPTPSLTLSPTETTQLGAGLMRNRLTGSLRQVEFVR